MRVQFPPEVLKSSIRKFRAFFIIFVLNIIYMNFFSNFFIQLGKTTLFQIVILFGMFFILGFLLYILSYATRKVFLNSGNQRIDIFFTGWIGTPIHELGHALFCVLFNHKIKEIKLFKPDKADGTLGYVSHSYDTKNLYHTIGNFFIGIGPIILGTFTIILLVVFLLPNSDDVLKLIKSNAGITIDFSHFFQSLLIFIKTIYLMIKEIISLNNFNSWKFWLFLYISLSVSSHMQLSPPDLKTMFRGLLVILGVLVIINIMATIWQFNINDFIIHNFKVGYIYIFVMLAISISILLFLTTYLIIGLFYLINHKTLLKPW